MVPRKPASAFKKKSQPKKKTYEESSDEEEKLSKSVTSKEKYFK